MNRTINLFEIVLLSVLLNAVYSQNSWYYEDDNIIFPGRTNAHQASIKFKGSPGVGSETNRIDSEETKSSERRGNTRGSSSSSSMRLCEIKYNEYIQRIFPDESDTVIDANDSEFNGRSLAVPGEYPHMAAVGFRSDNGKIDYKCGGSLISDRYVLTAAHCTNVAGDVPTKVRFGDLNLMVEETYLQPQIRMIKNIQKHPEYRANSYYNDIALLELDTEVELTEFVRPIRLWTRPTYPFALAYAMGYGSTAFALERTNRLTHLNMTLVSNEDCNREMPPIAEAGNGIIDSQLCARDYVLNRDTCQGDSGGPLQLNIRGRRSRNRLHYHQIGITSYGIFCRSGYPSIFTRVYSFLDWVESVVWKDDI